MNIKKLLFSQTSEVELLPDNNMPVLIMDYEGPLSFIEQYSKLTKELVIDEHAVITVIYSCKEEEKGARRDHNRLTEGDKEWMRSDCGILQSGHQKQNQNINNFQIWLCLSDENDKSGNENMVKLPVPLIQLPDDAGKIRVVVGIYQNQSGPIQADSFDFWDMRLNPGHTVTFDGIKNQNVTLFVISGEIILEDGKKLNDGELGILDQEGEKFSITSTTFTKVVFLRGSPIDEPIIGHGQLDLESVEKLKSE